MTADSLYHFTCSDHGLPGILESGQILPRKHPLFPHLGALVWLSDVASPTTPEQLGLTSDRLKCDRQRWRFEVRTRAAVPWTALRSRVEERVLVDLDSLGEPEHWYVVRRPVVRSEIVRPVVDMAFVQTS